MKVKGKTVFLSGPMSGIERYGVAAFADAHAMLKEAGAHHVYNPAIEYLTDMKSESAGHTHAYWMMRCLHELTEPMSGSIFSDIDYSKPKYSVLVSLPGWESSLGAKTEREVAKAIGMEVCDLSEVE